MRDHQRRRVYRWEDQHIKPRDQSLVPFEQIPAIVAHCWPDPYPPRVLPLPRQATKTAGTGHRLRLRFHTHQSTPTWIILHELAHALTCGDGHGPLFVGAYMQLLNRFMAIPLPFLFYTARISNVEYKL